jgi:hypothetical protein
MFLDNLLVSKKIEPVSFAVPARCRRGLQSTDKFFSNCPSAKADGKG